MLRALLIKGDSILNYTDEVKKIRESIKNEEELEYFVNFVRGIVQKEARVAEKNNPTKRSIIALATGSGKSKIAVDCIRDNHSSIEDTYHIFVPTEKLRDENWKEEFSNWGQLETFQKYVETHCYASASKVFSPSTVNYAILDEGHNITELSAKYFTNNVVDRAVLLTATVPKSEEKKRILEELDTSVENKRYIQEKTSEERRRRKAEKAAESEAYWNKVNSRKEQPAEDISNELKDSTTGKLVIGALALVGYGIYKVITHITKNDD